jgi:hypothetical protein
MDGFPFRIAIVSILTVGVFCDPAAMLSMVKIGALLFVLYLIPSLNTKPHEDSSHNGTY